MKLRNGGVTRHPAIKSAGRQLARHLGCQLATSCQQALPGWDGAYIHYMDIGMGSMMYTDTNNLQPHYWMTQRICNKANLRDLIAASGLVILFKLDSNNRFLGPHDLEMWFMTSKNNRSPLLILHQTLCSISKPLVNSNWNYSPKTPDSGQNRRFFCHVWPWNLINDLEK